MCTTTCILSIQSQGILSIHIAIVNGRTRARQLTSRSNRFEVMRNKECVHTLNNLTRVFTQQQCSERDRFHFVWSPMSTCLSSWTTGRMHLCMCQSLCALTCAHIKRPLCSNWQACARQLKGACFKRTSWST